MVGQVGGIQVNSLKQQRGPSESQGKQELQQKPVADSLSFQAGEKPAVKNTALKASVVTALALLGTALFKKTSPEMFGKVLETSQSGFNTVKDTLLKAKNNVFEFCKNTYTKLCSTPEVVDKTVSKTIT